MATLINYAELRCRTHYSFLRSASSPRELFECAAKQGYAALAIADRDGVYGIPRAYEAAREFPGTRLITGADLTLGSQLELDPERSRVGPRRLTLLARDRAGYGLLCRLLTASHKDREKGCALLGWDVFFHMIEERAQAARGLIALYDDETRIEDLHEVFEGRLYWPLVRALDGRDGARTEQALRVSRRFGIPLLATNDPRYHVPERRPLCDALTAIRLNRAIDRCGFELEPNSERYLKSPAEMARLFADLPDAVARTLEVAQECKFSPDELKYTYPSEWIPPGETAQSYLEILVWRGAKKRYPDGVPQAVEDQLWRELALVAEVGYADYFLTIWEIVDFAEKKKILCQGRGSAANSIICYCLGITAIDPVEMNLLFERFLSTERGEPPDIDVDFEHERREEVIQHVYEKYGRDRAAMVAAEITYHSRSITRDLSKALDCAPEELEKHPAFGKLDEEIRGFPRHLSIHSGGFTLSADPIIETVPVENARMKDRTIVQWDKEGLAILGLLKVDILSIGMLTAIRRTLDAVQAHEPGLTMAKIPQQDPATYSMIQQGKTIGVFQIESRAQMGMLGRLQPKKFYDLVVEVAIVRPGPIVGQMVHPYLRRRRGEERVDIPHPALEPILERTLGVPLFQEQIMKMAVTLAGFTPGEADQLRRAIGAWRSAGTIDKMGQKLKAGLLAKGLPTDFVERVFKQVQGFSEYGFPESHAASYALLAYISSYLKCHYPAEFTCALINSQPMGFYSSHTLIEEAQRHGVYVLPVDPNASGWLCEALPDSPYAARAPEPVGFDRPRGARVLRAGFSVVRGLSEADGLALVEERKRGPFTGLADFLWRARLKPAVFQALALGGAFEAFGVSQREALWEILAYQCFGAAHSGAQPAQMSLFAGHALGAVAGGLVPLNRYESILADYRSYGLSVRGHPLAALREDARWGPFLAARARWTSPRVRAAEPGTRIRAAGLLIVRQRPPTAKGTCFATLEDEHGFLDLVLHKDVAERFGDVYRNSPFLIVSGRTQKDGHTVNIIVTRLEDLAADAPERVHTISFR